MAKSKSHSAKNDVQTLAGTLAMLIVGMICLSLVIPDFRLAVITIVEIFLMLAPFLYAGFVAYKMITTTSDESTAYPEWKATTATTTETSAEQSDASGAATVPHIKPEYKTEPDWNPNPNPVSINRLRDISNANNNGNLGRSA